VTRGISKKDQRADLRRKCAQAAAGLAQGAKYERAYRRSSPRAVGLQPRDRGVHVASSQF
jgi:hypothetical protein